MRQGDPVGKRLRLRGVVQAMNLARRHLADGVPASEAGVFLDWVRDVVSQVELACRRHRTTPSRLPAPTYRAYLYLEAIARDGLPGPPPGSRTTQPGTGPKPGSGADRAPASKPMRSIRVANLVAVTARLRADMAALVRAADGRSWEAVLAGEGVATLFTRIRQNVERVESIGRRSPTGLAGLPAPSRQAYQWLRFLSDRETLEAHLTALRTTLEVLRQAGYRPDPSAGGHEFTVRVDFYNQTALYRVRVRPDGLHVTASEGFIHAPPEVLRDLVLAALGPRPPHGRTPHGRASRGKSSPHLARLRDWAAGEAYRKVSLALELGVGLARPETQGRRYDLEEVFQRVNATCFGGRVDRPTLTWNATLTRRKLGHYAPSTDTVMLSIALDDARVPAYVVEFVMYHELLHKHLGVRVVNGRSHAHTPAFREAEKEFPRYAEAQEFLKRFSCFNG